MKKDLTEIVFILDRSGSMASLTDDTIGGFNSMIEEQKAEPGEAYVTTVLFNQDVKVIHDHVDVKEITKMTHSDYMAMGMTSLLDAVGSAIDSVGDRLRKTPEEERPEKVIFVITTDGKENASREYTKHDVKKMIEHQQEKYSWVFMFIGANIDAVSEASSLGINSSYSKQYTATSRGVGTVYNAVSDSLACMRAVDTSTGDWTEQSVSIVTASLGSIE